MIPWVLAVTVQLVAATTSDEECDGAMMLQSRAEVNATSQDCERDMWDSSLHKSPFEGALKANFNQLSKSISQAMNSKAVHCKHVTISAGLFSETPLQGRNHQDEEVGKPAQYTGPTGCGIFIMNDWRVKMLEGYNGGWHLIPFNAAAFLHNIPENSKSNEIQRLYNLLKIASPLYLPEPVQQVTFGDEKCDLPAFAKKLDSASPGFDIYTFAHPNFFHRSLMRELKETGGHMSQRHELRPVFDDMERLHKYLGDEFLYHRYEIAEVMCMTWSKSKAVETFARRWFWYTTTFTMRPQLTWNAALLDCGQALRVKYMEFIEPLFK
eukprot:Skav211430  [mRNA]  locus=scaffold4594:53883:54854:+ [translate_table: standard]